MAHINPIFRENGTDLELEIGNEESINLEDPEEIIEPAMEGGGYISDKLIIELVNFLYNLDDETTLFLRSSDELLDDVSNFNHLARQLNSRIRIVNYGTEFEGTLISTFKLK